MSANSIYVANWEDFEDTVVAPSHEGPVLIDFWADWCAPCLVIAPVLEQVMAHYEGPLQLAKVEVDEGENMRLAGKYRVRGFPTIMLMQEGEEVARFAGARARHWIEDWLDDEQDYLVVVGALHLVGEDGVPALLDQAGFEIQQLKERQ